MEARRAQSYPDHEVLIGNPADQWKIVGNSVDRKMAVAAGLSLREAWLANDEYDGFIQSYVLTKQDLSNQDVLTTGVNNVEEDELVAARVPTLKRKRIADADELDDDLIIVKRPQLQKAEKRKSAGQIVELEASRVVPSQSSQVVPAPARGTTDELGDAASHYDVSIDEPPTVIPEVASSTARPRPAPISTTQTISTQSSTSIFAQFAARKRSPTTGRLIPRQSTSRKERVQPRSSNALAMPQSSLGSRRVTSVVTTGFLSPPTSEDQSPARQLPSSAPTTFPIQQGLFRSISQRTSSPQHDTDEDELSMHVDSALAVTSTDYLGLEPDVSAEDVIDEHREHNHATTTGQERPRMDDQADWMDYELTG